MSKWDFAELQDHCLKKGVADSTIYQRSLGWRWARADFHAEKAQAVWKELYGASFSTHDPRFGAAWFSYEAHVEGCVYALHAMADILAQIINIVVLKSRLKEEDVAVRQLVKLLKSEPSASQVMASIQRLLDSDEYCYIDAFCNTVKHRRLLDTKFRAEDGIGTRNKEGIKFLPFSYKGKTYPESWGDDILEYRLRINDLVKEVVMSLTEFVRNMP
jgi:hypothetical protein